MLPMDRRTVILAGLALGSGAAAAPPAPGARSPGLFDQVVRQPTGQNGYEELVAAADQLRSSKLFLQAEAWVNAPGLTLATQRLVLADPPVARALTLVQRGLAKPVVSPRDAPATLTRVPGLGGFRQIARLLRMRWYVHFADGRVSDAVNTLRIGLRLAYVTQTDTLVSGLVGVLDLIISARAFGAHLKQLAARDCELLYQVCAERLSQPDPLPHVIEIEQQGSTHGLATLGMGQGALEDLLGSTTGPKTGEVDIAKSQLLDELKQAQKLLDEFYQRILAESSKPAWQRSWPALSPTGDLAERLAAQVVFSPQQMGDRYTAAEAMVCLLAVHAAILRYRWEEDRLPATLALLNLGDLAVDLFTGQPLQYHVTGRHYQLGSTGAADNPPVSVAPE